MKYLGNYALWLDPKWAQLTWAANHLDGDETNETIFKIIVEVIDDHRRL